MLVGGQNAGRPFFSVDPGQNRQELRRRRTASAVDLARVFGFSPNAVRQQLVVLERDGLVAKNPCGADAPSLRYEFSLTSEADKLFPQALRQDADRGSARGSGAVRHRRPSPHFRRAIASAPSITRAGEDAETPEKKVAQLTDMLRENGVIADYSLIDGGFALHEHNCPYYEVAKDHPEVCSVIHHVIEETIGGKHVQTESLATGGKECRFEIKLHLQRRLIVKREYGFPEVSTSGRGTRASARWRIRPRAANISATRAATCTTSF